MNINLFEIEKAVKLLATKILSYSWRYQVTNGVTSLNPASLVWTQYTHP
jgi:hypothetical protein